MRGGGGGETGGLTIDVFWDEHTRHREEQNWEKNQSTAKESLCIRHQPDWRTVSGLWEEKHAPLIYLRQFGRRAFSGDKKRKGKLATGARQGFW